MKWQNWSGSVEFSPAEVHYPSTLDEIVALVQTCTTSGRKMRPVGAGHSFNPLVETSDVLVSLDKYSGIESIDHEAHTATLKAGTRLKQIGELLSHAGLAQENLGDINVQSIAGALSTGTHGTGVTLGNVSTQVTRLTLVIADGTVVECSESENPELFKAAQISLGALGIIVSVTLRLMPLYVLNLKIRRKSLAECLANLDEYKHNNRHFEFHWFPYTDDVQAKIANMSEENPRSKTFMNKVNEYALENAGLWALSVANRQFPSLSKPISELSGRLIADTDMVNYSHDVFSTVRYVKFQEMEYNLPAEAFKDAIHEIDTTIRKENIQVHFPIECRFTSGDDIYLSPAYGRESAYIAVHMFHGMEYQAYFDLMEAIFKRYDGRPHWGKIHSRTVDELSQLYPQWHKFQEQRNLCDPQRIFSNSYLTRLLG